MVTRTIYWNESAGGWYDLETDVWVKNLEPPTSQEQAEAPLQSNTDPLTRSEVIEVVREQARAIAEQTIGDRTIPRFPAYFMNRHWLVTYDWMADTEQRLQERIMQLELQVARLSTPWWRRWLH